MFKKGDKVYFYQNFSRGPEYHNGAIISDPYHVHSLAGARFRVCSSFSKDAIRVTKYTIKIEDHFGGVSVGVPESNISFSPFVIEEKKINRVYSLVDPYGEEEWEV